MKSTACKLADVVMAEAEATAPSNVRIAQAPQCSPDSPDAIDLTDAHTWQGIRCTRIGWHREPDGRAGCCHTSNSPGNEIVKVDNKPETDDSEKGST